MKRVSSSLRLLPSFTVAMAVAMATLSCADEQGERVADVNDAENTPTMTTTNVETFISDSGYTRYHITTPVWYVYDEARVPRWTFPDGLFLEKYDDSFRPDAKLRCDSAIYFSQKKLWRLDGNVKMRNTAGDRFMTQQLYWDQTSHTVYSDSFIHIERSDKIIEGLGFNSNENMTRYTVRHPSGIFPVDTERKGEATDNTPATPSATPAATEPSAQKKNEASAKDPRFQSIKKSGQAIENGGDTPPSFRP